MLLTTQKLQDSGNNAFAFSVTILTVLPPGTKHTEHPKDLGDYPVTLEEDFFQNISKNILNCNIL